MDRLIFLEVHRGGTLERSTGTEALVSSHTYKGGSVRTWAVKKADCTISKLLGRLKRLDGYLLDSYWFYEDIHSSGKRVLAPLHTETDAEALADLGEWQAGIRVFVQHGIAELTGWD